jgi:Tetracyclin repressor-like, C-terminal domain
VLRERIGKLRERIDAAASRREDPWDQLIAAIAVQVDATIADDQLRSLIEQAPVALGIARRRELDRELSLPPLLRALQGLDADDRLAQPASELVAEVLLRAINEAALAAAAEPDVSTARREAASTVTAMARGLRRAPRIPQSA